MNILFKNALILRRDANGKYYSIKGYLGIRDSLISYIGENEPSDKYDFEKDMANKLLMPGLINAHGHSPMTLLRGLGGGTDTQSWLNDYIFPLEDKMVPNDIQIGCELACLEMLGGGTTCCSEMYDYPFMSLMAFSKAGIRANVTRAGLCFDPNIEMKDWYRFQQVTDFVNILDGKITTCDEIRKELEVDTLPIEIKEAVNDGRIKGELSNHSEYLSTSTFVKELSIFSSDKSYTRQGHASESEKETKECISRHGITPIKFLHENNFLEGGKAYLAHCVWANDEDLDIMANTGTSLVYCPTSNLKLGSGVAPIAKALKKGINVALGTDGCASNNNLDMFEEMHIGALLQSGVNHTTAIIDSSKIIDMATINGAKALGRKDIGQLEVGYKADIIAIDLSSPHLYPNNDIAELIVYSMHASDVCYTMVNGKTLYENGVYYTLNVDDIKSRVNATMNRLLSK